MKTLAMMMGVLLWASAASAHGGGQDANGCHNDKKAGNYHCHKGPLAGQSFKSKEDAIKAMDQAKPAGKEMPKPR